MRSLATVTAGALGVWLGMQAIRAFLLAMAWNVAEDHTPQLAALGAVIWLVGLAGWLPRRLIGRRRPTVVLAAVFGILAVARQAFNIETVYATLAIAAVVVWLWWFAAFVDDVARRGERHLLVRSMLLGLAIQVSVQLWLSGLDVHGLIDAGGVIVVCVVVVVWLVAVARSDPPYVSERAAGLGWGTAALLPFLYLQLTLFANLGRLESLGGVTLPWAGIFALLCLGASAVVSRFEFSRVALAAVAVATVACVYVGGTLGGVATGLLLLGDAGLTILLAAAVSTGGRRTSAAYFVGGVLFFGLIFATYYDFSDSWARFAWPVGAALIGAIGVLAAAGRSALRWSPGYVTPILLVGLVGVIAAAAPGPAVLLTEQPAPSGPIRLLNFNLHQGVSRNGIPSLPAQASVIGSSRADILLLQEVNRVWDLSGGIDSYAWLDRRLTGNDSVWAPMHGVHFGLSIFSQSAIADWGWQRFPLGPSGTPRAFIWANVSTSHGQVLVITTHLTPYNRANEAAERDSQAALLIDFWHSRGSPTMILTGDLNAEPDTPTINRLKDAGLVDALAEGGVGDEITFVSTGNLFRAPSAEKLDYIFITQDLITVRAQIIESDVSDHNALYVELRPR